MIEKTEPAISTAEEQYQELVAGISDKIETGEPGDLEAYIARYPQYADRLRRAASAMQSLFDLGRESVSGTGPEAASARERS